MRTCLVIMTAFYSAFVLAQPATWENVFQKKATNEIGDALTSIIRTEYSKDYILGNAVLLKLDISKSTAYNSMIKSANPTSLIFQDGTFISIMSTTIESELKPKGSIDNRNLENALNNSTNSNQLVSPLLGFNPIGAAVTSAMSVVNSFFQKRGGLFRFLQGFFTPNYKDQISNINKKLEPYILVYQKMNTSTDNAILATTTYSKLINSDFNNIRQMVTIYNNLRSTVIADYNNPKIDPNNCSSELFIGLIQKTYQVSSTTQLNSVEQYSEFILDENIQNMVRLAKKIDEQIVQMAYHSIAYNTEVKVYMNEWIKQLTIQDVTKDAKDSKDIVDTITQAIKDIDALLNDFQSTIEKSNQVSGKNLIEKTIESQNKGFFLN